MASARSGNSGQQSAGATVQLAVKGWTTSKLASTRDQGLEFLLVFLEKKASRPILAHRMAGRTVLLITIKEHDKDRFTHLNGFTFSGASLVVEDARPPRHQQQQHSQPINLEEHLHQLRRQNVRTSPPPRTLESRTSQPITLVAYDSPPPPRNRQLNGASHQAPTGPSHANRRATNTVLMSEIENVIISVVRKRYHAADKHLVLNTLVADPELLQSGLSDQDAGKVYKAIFAICETKIWETPSKRAASVASVSLRDNGIKTVQDIISLASVFPRLQNLDLANNGLEDLGALKYWKNQFRDLEHLILTGNPVAAKPDTLSTLLKWYPRLKMYNNEPVVHAASASTSAAAASTPSLGLPTPAPAPSPVAGVVTPQAATQLHPEFPPGSTFGIPAPDKPAEQLFKEQMGLQFSFETKLRMQWVENCLSANNWDYPTAMDNFAQLKAQGAIPADAYIEGV